MVAHCPWSSQSRLVLHQFRFFCCASSIFSRPSGYADKIGGFMFSAVHRCLYIWMWICFLRERVNVCVCVCVCVFLVISSSHMNTCSEAQGNRGAGMESKTSIQQGVQQSVKPIVQADRHQATQQALERPESKSDSLESDCRGSPRLSTSGCRADGTAG